jgi:hypothetical protein
VEQLWIATLELRNQLSAPVFFFGLLLPAEYDKAFDNERVGAFIASLNEKELLQAINPTAVLEQHRPYVGEMLWLRFFVYRAFLGRLTHLILDGKRRKHIQDWRADQGVHQILGHVISDNVRKRILVQEPAVTAVNVAVNTLEELILEEISLIMSGRRSSDESFQNAQKLRDALASLSAKTA